MLDVQHPPTERDLLREALLEASRAGFTASPLLIEEADALADAVERVLPTMARRANQMAFFVPGEPQPQGSKVVRTNVRRGRPVPEAPKFWLVEDNQRSRPWRTLLSNEAARLWGGRPPLGRRESVALSLLAVFPRPGYHFSQAKHPGRADGLLPCWAGPIAHVVDPDLDKLTRAAGDALKVAGVIRDDAQIAEFVQPFGKWYADPGQPWGGRPGMHVRLEW
jgi:endodeoxyribonuclease RusA